MFTAPYRFCSLSSQSDACCHVNSSASRAKAVSQQALNLDANPATPTHCMLKSLSIFIESWFSDASIVRLPAEFSGVGLGFTAPVTGEGGRVHMSDPDDGMFKNSGMASCRTGLAGGWRGCIEQCVVNYSLSVSLVLWIKVPVLPVKNEITLTEGKLSVLLIVYLRYSGGPSELQLRAVDAHSSFCVSDQFSDVVSS